MVNLLQRFGMQPTLQTTILLRQSIWHVIFCQQDIKRSSVRFACCRFFYEGQLLNGAGIDADSKGAPFHRRLAFKPFVSGAVGVCSIDTMLW
jgi:hypothetical protein